MIGISNLYLYVYKCVCIQDGLHFVFRVEKKAKFVIHFFYNNDQTENIHNIHFCDHALC